MHLPAWAGRPRRRTSPVEPREFSFCLPVANLALSWEQVGVDPFSSEEEASRPPARMLPKPAPQGPRKSLESYLADSRGIAELLVQASNDLDVYRLGMDMFHVGAGPGPEGELANAIIGALTWIWGDLTDAVDAPDAGPDTTQAAQKMRRAAQEWLLASDDPSARVQYLDHWQYNECGTRRPPKN